MGGEGREGMGTNSCRVASSLMETSWTLRAAAQGKGRGRASTGAGGWGVEGGVQLQCV